MTAVTTEPAITPGFEKPMKSPGSVKRRARKRLIKLLVYLFLTYVTSPLFLLFEGLFRPFSIAVMLCYEEETMSRRGKVNAMFLSILLLPFLLLVFASWALPQLLLNTVAFIYKRRYRQDIFKHLPSLVWTKRHAFFEHIYSFFLWIGSDGKITKKVE